MVSFVDDLRYALRALTKRPLFALGAVVMLALGIGANTAIFSMHTGMGKVAERFEAPDELFFIRRYERGLFGSGISGPELLAWMDRAGVFQAMGAYRQSTRYVTGAGEPRSTGLIETTPGLLPMLGLDAHVGRLYGPDDASPSAPPVAVLTHRLWTERYGGDEDILGTGIVLNDAPHTVIGVLPAKVQFELLWHDAGVFAPLVLDPSDTDRESRSYRVMARLADDATPDQAQDQLTALANRLVEAQPDADADVRVVLEPFREYFYSAEDKLAMVGLIFAVGAVLLIACVNLANLLLAKAATRQGEVAVRIAVGATRARLVRQLLCESLILALAGGAFGILLGLWGMDLLVSSMSSTLFLKEETGLDGALLSYTLAVSAAAALAFGLAPALLASRVSPGEGMKRSGAGASSSRGQKRFRSVILVAQLALTVPLVLTCAVSFMNIRTLERIDLGFETAGLLTAQLEVPLHRYPDANQQARLSRDVMGAVRGVPGVTAAAAAASMPIGAGLGSLFGPLVAEGHEGDEGSARGPGGFQPVTVGYFGALGAPLVGGRDFTADDVPGSPPVAIVNQAFVRRYWPGEDPLGRRLYPETDEERIYPGYRARITDPLTVVGVVADFGVTFYGEPPNPELFVPQAQVPSTRLVLVARTDVALAQVVPAVRDAIGLVDPGVPVTDFRTGDTVIDDWLRESRMIGIMLGLLAVLALGLTVIGLYGMVAHAVVRRTFELGVRMVLGADPGSVRAAVMGSFLALGGAGLAIGIVLALLVGLVARSFLVLLQVPYVPTTVVIAGLLLAVVALAAYVPARRATRIQPATALRCE